MPVLRPALLATLLIAAATSQGPGRAMPKRTEIADGVFLFQTEPYGDAGLDGNAVAIVSDGGVVMFDANGTPEAARAVIASLRQVTAQPVKYLVLSHWHWDHWYGVKSYVEAFPGIHVVAQERTRTLMAGPALEFNEPGLADQFPAHIKAIEAAATKAKASGGADTTIARLEAHAAFDTWFLAQKREGGHALPDLTFRDTLTLTVGPRVVQVWSPGHAITPGDAMLWLPADRVAIVGDLLINPITFGLFSYPKGWIAALDHIDSLDARVIVGGHGEPMRDASLLRDTRALLEREYAIAADMKRSGKPWADAKAAVLADSASLALRARITGGVAARNDAFSLYLVEWVVKRMYGEIDGTLGDSIPKGP